MIDACFTYGSLMCEDIMSAVSGMTVSGEPARLPGHVRHPVRDEDYPGMVPDASGQVAGVLYRGLNEAALLRLDRFEGEMYERRVVTVLTEGEAVEVWTYVFRPEFAHLLLAGDWSFERFLSEGKARFELRYVGFDAIGG